MHQLFFDNTNKSYYLVCSKDDLDVHCSYCNKIIPLKEHIFIHKSFSKKEYLKEYLCRICIQNHKKRIYDEFVSAEITSIIPNKSTLVPDFPPSLQATRSNITTFDALEKDAKEGIEIDDSKAIQSKNPDFMKMSDYEKAKLDFKKREKELSTDLKSEKDVDDYLKNLTDAPPLIEEHKKKRLEVKK